jgi:hypothetical protein
MVIGALEIPELCAGGEARAGPLTILRESPGTVWSVWSVWSVWASKSQISVHVGRPERVRDHTPGVSRGSMVSMVSMVSSSGAISLGEARLTILQESSGAVWSVWSVWSARRSPAESPRAA